MKAPGLFDAPDYMTWQPDGNINMKSANSSPYFSPALNPFVKATNPQIRRHRATATSEHYHFVHGVFGYEFACRSIKDNFDETSTDNVHNHLMGQR